MSDEKTNKPNDRRDFLKLAGLGVLGLAAANAVLNENALAQSGGGAEPLNKGAKNAVKENEPQAQALGYYEDAKKVDLKKWPKRAGSEGAKQFCYNCQFYQAKTANPKAEAQAPCTIFANRDVKGMGWCNSWVMNPKVKG